MAFHSGLIASLVHTPIKLCFFVFFYVSLLKEQFDTTVQCQLLLDWYETRAACFELSTKHLFKAENHLCKADEERRSSSCG